MSRVVSGESNEEAVIGEEIGESVMEKTSSRMTLTKRSRELVPERRLSILGVRYVSAIVDR